MPVRPIVVLSLLLLISPVALSSASAQPSGFTLELIEWESGGGSTCVEFLPNGTMLVGLKTGTILAYAPDGGGGFDSPIPLHVLTGVDFSLEAGLLGLAVDPEFASTRHLFAFHTTPTDQRLVRLTVNAAATGIVPGSETVILSGLPREWTFHKAGDLEFRPGDPVAIFIALGDDGDPTPCPDPDYYHGKILRVDKATGLGLPDNPFYDGNSDSIRSRVWATGHRNPFRIAFHPSVPDPNAMYVSENGDFLDRVSKVERGADGDWGTGFSFIDAPHPGHTILQTLDPSLIGIVIAESGPFADGPNPVLYVGQWHGGSEPTTGVRRYRMVGPELDQLEPLDGGGYFLPGTLGVDLTFGPDGALYVVESGGDAGGDRIVHRVVWTAGEAPVASFTTDPVDLRGEAPFEVAFTDTSTDADGVIVSRLWDFGDGTTSTDLAPTHTFGVGRHRVTLTVTDDTGAVATTVPVDVEAYRTVTIDLTASIEDARTTSPTPLATPTELRFYQADGDTPLAVPGGGGPDANVRAVLAGGVFAATLPVELLADGFVVSAGEAPTDGVASARAGVGVDPAKALVVVALDFHLSDLIVRGRAVGTRGEAPPIDVGVQRLGVPYGFAGGRDFVAPASPIGVAHRRTLDALGYFHVPVRVGDGDVEFTLDFVGDTGLDDWWPEAVSLELPSATEVVRDVVVGRIGGGEGCDDLTSIPTTPAVDYESAIQSIWASTCLGCHHPGAYEPDLSAGSAARLVDVARFTPPHLHYVVPGRPEASFLFEKIHCDAPQLGDRMRPGSELTLAQQALIRDWILQLDDATPFIRGDANLDGAVNVADPITTLGVLFQGGIVFGCPAAADSNLDATIDLADAIYTIDFLFSGGPPPPAPYPTCGSAAGAVSCPVGPNCP